MMIDQESRHARVFFTYGEEIRDAGERAAEKTSSHLASVVIHSGVTFSITEWELRVEFPEE